MATTDHTAALHAPLCQDLLDRFLAKNPNMTVEKVMEEFVKLGVIDASRLFEVVKSQETGIPLKSIEGIDLADDSNCKLTAAYGPVNGQYTAFGWRIKVTNCRGDVRAIIHHPSEKKTYEAHIPFSEHRNQRWITVTDCKRGPKFGRWTKYMKEVQFSK